MTCPFCKCDPFHYVDVGIGMVPVGVVCCDPGIDLYSQNKTASALAHRILRLRQSNSPRKKARAKKLMVSNYG